MRQLSSARRSSGTKSPKSSWAAPARSEKGPPAWISGGSNVNAARYRSMASAAPASTAPGSGSSGGPGIKRPATARRVSSSWASRKRPGWPAAGAAASSARTRVSGANASNPSPPAALRNVRRSTTGERTRRRVLMPVSGRPASVGFRLGAPKQGPPGTGGHPCFGRGGGGGGAGEAAKRGLVLEGAIRIWPGPPQRPERGRGRRGRRGNPSQVGADRERQAGNLRLADQQRGQEWPARGLRRQGQRYAGRHRQTLRLDKGPRVPRRGLPDRLLRRAG